MVYGQAGRRATVYQLKDERGDLHALKVFMLAFRKPEIEEQALRIARFASLPGLAACQREVVTEDANSTLISKYSDLRYAVLMPWVLGKTWQEIVISRTPASRAQARRMADSLVRLLLTMEQNGMAHCDLSGPNVIISQNETAPAGNNGISLIDLEDLYAPGLQQPAKLPGGSLGYAHPTVRKGVWSPYADRFSGGLLMAEMLGWCDERVRQGAFGEQYFSGNDDEMQKPGDRFTKLASVLQETWGAEVKALFEQTWFSQSLESCPRFADWARVLNVSAPQARVQTASQPAASDQRTPPLGESPVKGWRTFTGEQKPVTTPPRVLGVEAEAPQKRSPAHAEPHSSTSPKEKPTLIYKEEKRVVPTKDSSFQPFERSFSLNLFMVLLVLSLLVGAVFAAGSLTASKEKSPASSDNPVTQVARDPTVVETAAPVQPVAARADVTQTLTPQPGATPDFQATNQGRFISQTVVASTDRNKACWIGIPVASDFKKSYCFPFDQETSLWPWLVDTSDDEWGYQVSSLSQGSLIWEWQTLKSVISRITKTGTYKDFEVITNAGVNRSNFNTAAPGIIFREAGADFYYFQLNGEYYSAYLIQSGEWTNLIVPTYTPYAKPGSNWLGVKAEGSHFWFYINGELVNEIEDSSISEGAVGIAVQMDAGEDAVLHFDDFAILTNDQSAACNPIKASLYSINASNYQATFDNERLYGSIFVFNGPFDSSGDWEMTYHGNILNKGYSTADLPCEVRAGRLYCGPLSIYTGGVPYLTIQPVGDSCEVYRTNVEESFMKMILDQWRK